MSKETVWAAAIFGATTLLCAACGQPAEEQPTDSQQELTSASTRPSKKDGGQTKPGDAGQGQPWDGGQGQPWDGGQVVWPVEDGGVGQPWDGGQVVWPVEDGGVGQPWDGGQVIWPVDGGTASTCSMEQGAPVTFTSAQLPGLVAGKWRFCGGDYPVEAGEGIELDAANHVFYILVENSAGNLVRESGKNGTGTLTFEGDQVILNSKTWGMYAFPTFRRGPRVMQFNPGVQNPPLYVPVP